MRSARVPEVEKLRLDFWLAVSVPVPEADIVMLPSFTRLVCMLLVALFVVAWLWAR